jgi:catechol 2,3-dioxygenase-like lactoylglutathione lyase family enzyme
MAIFTHVCLGAVDLNASRIFYDATLETLGIKNLGPYGEEAYLYGVDGPEFSLNLPINGHAATHANGGTVGFAAATRAQVRDFHAAGLAAGGSNEGEPGPRDFSETSYAAYLRDPAGNKICAFCFADGE